MSEMIENRMDICVTKTNDSIFNGLICKEPVDELMLHKLINSDLLETVINSKNAQQYDG